MTRKDLTSIAWSPAALILVYLALTLPALTRYPAVWVDEGWISEVAAQISRGLPPGNPSHGQLFHYHDRLFWMPPLYFMGLAGWFGLFGVGLPVARLFSVLAGGATVLLLFYSLRRRTSPPAAFWASLLALSDTFVWKAHRTVRFESLLGGLALLLFLRVVTALEREENDLPADRAWWAAGLAAGLAVNVHPNGALFVLGAALLVIGRRRGARRSWIGPWKAAGIAAALLLPWLLYCLTDAGQGFANLIGQNSFHLTSEVAGGPAPLSEWRRWAGFFVGPWRAPLILVWAALIVRALRRAHEPMIGATLIMVGAAVTLYIFIPNKTLLYLVPVTWFMALLAGLLWDGTGARWFRPLLIGAVLLNLAIDGGLLARSRPCRVVDDLAEIRAQLKPGDRVAGTFVTWWAVQPLPFHEFSRGATREAVERFDPTVILLGDRQWGNEVRTRFGPLDRALVGPDGPLRDRAPDFTLENSCLGPVRFYRLRDP